MWADYPCRSPAWHGPRHAHPRAGAGQEHGRFDPDVGCVDRTDRTVAAGAGRDDADAAREGAAGDLEHAEHAERLGELQAPPSLPAVSYDRGEAMARLGVATFGVLDGAEQVVDGVVATLADLNQTQLAEARAGPGVVPFQSVEHDQSRALARSGAPAG